MRILNFILSSVALMTAVFCNAETPTPINGSFSSSSMHFDMDACSAYNALTTNFDYSEFTPVVTNSSSCLQMSIMGGNLYRDEPLRNPHSCTEGVDGSTAMCVSSVMDCAYPAGHMRSVKIDVIVEPGTDGTGTLSSLSFYEQAPENYSWIDGGSGPNNYPTLYGMRVLKDGVEVYRSERNSTSTDWTLESFSFLDEPAFVVDTRAVFTFEFIGYCLINNGSTVSAWDLDEITIESSCGTIIDGGSLSLNSGSTATNVCVGLGQDASVNVQVSGNQGPNSSYVITDESGIILDVPASGPPFDFEGAGTGVCLIWHVSSDGNLGGLTVGSDAANLTGCFNLSNPVTVTRTTADGGTISGGPNGTTVCAHGSNLVEVDLTGNSGNSRWVVTDMNGMIIGLPSGSPFDLSTIPADECILWHLSYTGNIGGLSIGGNANNISGDCFDLSNPLTLIKQGVDGGVLSSDGVTYINICEGDGNSNIVDVVVNNNDGANSQLVITDAQGNIIDANPSFPYDFSGSTTATYSIYNVSWNEQLTGLSVGSNINNLSGFCFAISNSVTIDKEGAEGGSISSTLGNNISVCVKGVVSDQIPITLTGADGEFGRWIITDNDGNIIGLPGAPPIRLDPELGDNCMIWHLSFESSFQGLFLGQNVADFSGCYDLSNPISVSKSAVGGGVISENGQTFINYCGTQNQILNVGIRDNFGDNSVYALTDDRGIIIELITSTPIDFSNYGNGSYRLTHVAYNGSLSVLSVGSDIATLSGECFDVSNTMTIDKFSPSPGTISTASGTIEVCADGFEDNVEVTLTGNVGAFNRWLLTDLNGNIIGLPNGSPFNFEGYPNGSCLLWNVSYENGISGLVLGENAADLVGCFALSNSIQVNKIAAIPGNISADGRTTVSICLEDSESDVIDVTLSGNDSDDGAWVITDDQGSILEVVDGPPFDFSNAGTGVCRIYFVAYNEISGLTPGASINDFTGCYGISNSITVNRNGSEAGRLSTDGGFEEVSVCVGDGNADLVNVFVNGSDPGGTDRFVITDEDGTILGLPGGSPIDFEGAGVGICYIWNLNSNGTITGLVVGGNVNDIEGCHGFSNPVVVNRSSADGGAATRSVLLYNMESCDATNITEGEQDYSEFTPLINNSSACTQLSGSNVYRNNPTVNTHSCTPGFNGMTATCISSLNSCTYEANSDLALRFDVTVTPGPNGQGSISTLSFYEAAPQNFTWINGTSGINNFPTQYGIRVLKNGTEVYRLTEQETSNFYSIETFDFSSNPDFTVTTTTVFSFELLGYCLVGANSTVSAWDIDDIRVESTCQGGLNGGTLSIQDGAGGSTDVIDVCADDGEDENIMVSLLDAAGPNMSYVITDINGDILALPSNQPFNFEGAGEGVCLIWNLAFINGLRGAFVGANAADLQGCYSLSNPITVNRFVSPDCPENIIAGGNLTLSSQLTDSKLCVDDGLESSIMVDVYGNSGSGSIFLLTNEFDVITKVVNAFPMDLEGYDVGTMRIYHVSYEGILENMSPGFSLLQLEGEFAISNRIELELTSCMEEEVDEVLVIEEFATAFDLYPNPSSNQITIRTNVLAKNISEYIIYDSYGRILSNHTLSEGQELKVNVTDLAEGVYYIKMISGLSETMKRFTKM